MPVAAQQLGARAFVPPERRSGVGVVAAAGADRQRLVAALSGQVLVPCAITPDRLPAVVGQIPGLAAWVACLPADGSSDACLDLLWEQAGVPVFVTDALPATSRELAVFCRQVIDKVAVTRAEAEAQAANTRVSTPCADLSLPAQAPAPPLDVAPVFLLAASLGGPLAVRQFLQALPAVPPVALLYAQHIAAGFTANLAELVCRGTRVRPVTLADAPLAAGELAVVPVSHQLQVTAEGALVAAAAPWRGSYQPDIGAMTAAVARVFGAASGVVFFSGMGDDGAAVAARASQLGLTVWAQQPDSCVSPVMPEAVLATGCCSGSGTPMALAATLAAFWSAAAVAAGQSNVQGANSTSSPGAETST